ncbi:guanylate kinase [Endomicrobium proavitum]|uniref:Guanylate kinase n=1 Tax=Endomicrobium proavitum TaxID=1408281 RepID=A0A0G3WI60_9BACT|nr:guanylate kinase [Endomicrobium proavitum]AKL97552.1 Guanylate kinase [Endomicrobium proavitum]
MKNTQNKGNIIVVSAPSGAGKTSICDATVKKCANAVYSISYTTRKPRIGETDGNEYFFTDDVSFKKMVKAGKFAEWAKVHGHYYGTPKSFLEKTLNAGKNVILDIDVQGGLKIKKHYPQACMIFVMTPDLKTLEKRLTGRNKDSKETIAIRMQNAKKELKYLSKYNYLVINDNLQDAIFSVNVIIESLKYKIQKDKKYF